MVTLRPYVGLVPTGDVRARTVGGARRSAARLARRATHPRHVAWLEGSLDRDPADVDVWIADGSLRVDEAPRLRLVEQRLVDGHRVLGVLGLVDLADLVPHEGTDDAAVRRRAARDRRQQVDSRPLLCVLPADPPQLGSLLAEICSRPSEIDIEDTDGVRHRTWVLTPEEADALAAALAVFPCLLADGHHRVAAARLLGRDAMPALVAFAGHAPFLDDVWRLAAVGRDDQAQAREWVERLPDDPTGIVEVRHGRLVRRLRSQDGELPVETSQRIADAVPGMTRVTSTADPATVAIALRDGVVAVGSGPPSVAEVLEAVARGRALPPKSTAFRPKPRVGLVLHRSDQTAAARQAGP